VDPKGRVAVITGGALGIGKGIARRLGEAGAAVVIADINDHAAAATVAAFEAAGLTACSVHTDVAGDDDLHAMIDFARDQLGSFDILVNNAGIGMNGVMPGNPPGAWSDIIHVYLRQYMLGTQLAIQAMEGRGGAVLNIASAAGVGFKPHPWPEYATAKAGVMRFTACMAPENERVGVRVNAICPGWVATEGVLASLEGLTDDQKRRRNVPDPMLTPEDIGDTALELIRDDMLAGRVMLHYIPGEKKLIPVETEY
jgi:NAD(P)-dependent dehydrogenase (short-subunit alcohol dehydrogenase family)